MKDKIQIGEKIGNLVSEVTYSFKAKITHKGKKGRKLYTSDKDGIANGTFEPQALGFSYPDIRFLAFTMNRNSIILAMSCKETKSIEITNFC